MKRGVLAAVSIAGVIGLVSISPRMTANLSGQASGFPSTKNGEWPYYTADVRGSRYSPLDQINGGNFNQLEVAWRFKTDNLGTRPEFKLEGTTYTRTFMKLSTYAGLLTLNFKNQIDFYGMNT